MRHKYTALLVLLVLTAAACTSNGDAESTSETTTVAGPADIATMEDGTTVITEGVLVITDVARLCETIVGTIPPQCDGAFVVLSDLQVDDVVDLRSAPDPQGDTTHWANYPFVVNGTVDGGNLINVEGHDRVYPAADGGLRVRVLPAQSPVFPQQLRSGEAIWFAIDATNLTDQGIPMTFNSGQVAEVTLSDGDTEVYRWSTGRSFTQSVNDVEFPGGETSGATLRDNLFTVDPGTYTLRAWITAVGAEDIVVEVPVEVIAP